MKIVTLFKVVPDDQDLQAAPDGTLDSSKAKPVASSFDLSAIEAAARLAETLDGVDLVALSAGPSSIDDSKLKKNILARGPQALHYIVDDALQDADTHATAQVLATGLETIGEYDLVICGDGSADVYAQQVGIQVAELLKLPVVNAVSAINLGDGVVTVERTLESEQETIELSLPAVVCVSSDIAVPRICGMKEILAAGRRPVVIHDLEGLGVAPVSDIEVVDVVVPRPVDRRHAIFDAAVEGDVQRFADALAAAIK